MKRAFTLIELMVVVVILMVMVGVGTVSTVRFLAREKLTSAKNEVLSAVKLARNYAVTNQSPAAFNQQMDWVAVIVNGTGLLSVKPVNLVSGTGVSFFSNNISKNGVVVTPVWNGALLFSVPEGKLLNSNGLGPRGDSYKVLISLSSNEGVAETMTISIDANGKIW